MFKWFGGKKESEQSAVQTAKPEEKAPEQARQPEEDREQTLASPPQPERVAEAPAAEPVKQGGFLASLKAAVSLSSQSIVGRITGILEESEITGESIDEIEEVLIRADVGLDTASEITDKLRQRKDEFRNPDKLMDFLRQEFINILTPYENANHLAFKPGVLNVYLVVGVNGAGKTTFIGKLANRFIKQGRKVMIGAGDTFRAAAEEQLEVWAQRAGAGFVGAGELTDPAAVIFEALKQAKESQADVVLLDTAGRLQNKFNLMEELRKVRKVIDQAMPPGGNLESLLVLDATTGQNALKQASVFKEAVDISGVVLTKLDSSAKGGIVLTIAQEYHLPVKMVGVGEGIDDLREFNAREFVDGLFQR